MSEKGRRVPPAKVLYFNPTAAIGGAELCLLDVISGIQSKRPQWSLKVLLADDGPFRLALEEIGVATKVIPIPTRLALLGDSSLKPEASTAQPQGRLGKLLKLSTKIPGAAASTASYLATLRLAIRAERPDILHTNGMKAHLLGAFGASRTVPVVWQMHDYASSRALMSKLLRAARRPRLRVVAVSKSVAADTQALLGPDVPVDCIYNAIDLDRFSPGDETTAKNGSTHDAGAWLDELSGLPTAPVGTVRVGLVATYARWKGQDVFLEAAKHVTTSEFVRFYIVGGPIYQSAGSQFSIEDLKARASALGLDGKVGFVPHQSDPARVFRSLDVVVHASTRPEPFGRVIVEGMACGRAVVASQEGGAAELFEDGVSALGCPPNDPKALAVRIKRLIESPELRKRLGVAGRAAAASAFDRKRLGGEWVRLYETFW